MDIINILKNLFLLQPRRRYKYIKYARGNKLVVDIGTYADDNIGMNDYKRYYKVKRGKIQKKMIRQMKKGEDTNMFNTFELTPTTNLARVVVIEKPLSSPPPISTKMWKVILTRKQGSKGPIVIQI